MDLMQAIRERRSVRTYDDRPVSRETLVQVLEAALLAPSGQNLQPVRFWVIGRPTTLRELERDLYAEGARLRKMLWLLGPIVPQLRDGKGKQVFRSLRETLLNGAPVLVLIGADRASSSTFQKDCTLAAQNLMLAAHGLGLSSCYVGWSTLVNRLRKWKERLRIGASVTIVDGIVLGYGSPPPRPPSRKGVDEVTTWIL
ncbi:MAG: nitroreductase [Planctomycetota bacterium]